MAEEKRVRRVKTKRKLRIKRSDTFYFLIITMVCLVVALAVAFMMGRGPSLLDSFLREEENVYIEKLSDMKEEAVKKYGKENIDDLIKKYKDRKGTAR
ncbi:MAG: hypothetical protein JXR85_01730 [Deltaproteobacteria bacterium]|nr:hypothetical protein [Deltaproteobacteria bacterium]